MVRNGLTLSLIDGGFPVDVGFFRSWERTHKESEWQKDKRNKEEEERSNLDFPHLPRPTKLVVYIYSLLNHKADSAGNKLLQQGRCCASRQPDRRAERLINTSFTGLLQESAADGRGIKQRKESIVDDWAERQSRR